jgi:hypothetical protein
MASFQREPITRSTLGYRCEDPSRFRSWWIVIIVVVILLCGLSTYGKYLHQQSKQKKLQQTDERVEKQLDARVAARAKVPVASLFPADANTQFDRMPTRRNSADAET